MKTTTLNKILLAGPCGREPVSYANQGDNFGKTELTGWLKLLAGLEAKYGKPYGRDEVLPFADIVEVNGLPDALWCCRTRPDLDDSWRAFDTWCVTQQAEFLVPELRPAYTILLAHVEGFHHLAAAACESAWGVRLDLMCQRKAREKRMTLPQAVEWSTTDAAAKEFSAIEIATALCHALSSRAYIPGEAAYYAAEGARFSGVARKAQKAKFLEIVQ